MDKIVAPTSLINWLTHTGQLSKRLESLAGDSNMRVLREAWEPSDDWDKVWVGSCEVLHREIAMYAHQIPCWYAKTLLPRTTFAANERLFSRLQHEPLGQLIFQGDAIQRVFLRHYPLHPLSTEYRWLPEELQVGQTTLWMRWSQFKVLQTHSFYLAEILLPGVERYGP